MTSSDNGVISQSPCFQGIISSKKKKSRISMTLQVFQIRWTPCLVFLTYRFPSQEPPEHEIIFTKLDTQSFKQFV